MSNERTCAFLKGAKKIELGKMTVGEPGPNDVLISMKRVGICGSDLGLWQTGQLLGLSGENVVMGHECGGIIAKVGSDVKHLKEGDKVALNPAISSCGKCKLCRSNAAVLCGSMKPFGFMPNSYGGLMEALVHPAECVFKLPDNMTMDEAASMEPIWVAYRACLKAGISLGSTVLITGAGPIGLSIMLVAIAMGAAKVAITDLDEKRLAIAKSAGAAFCFTLTRDGDTMTTAAHITKEMGASPDCVLETSGAESAINLAIACSKKLGTIINVGIPSGKVNINLPMVVAREIQIKGTLGYNVDKFDEMIEMVANGKINVKPLVTHHFPLYKTQEAFETAARREGMKVMICCDEVEQD